MIGMQYNTNSQAKGGLEVNCFPPSTSTAETKCKKGGNFASSEPISVLDTRSPSPSTSSSTLSSSFGGTNGGGNSDSTPNLVVGSQENNLKGGVLPSPHDQTATATAAANGAPKEEWMNELCLPAGLELSQGGSEKFNLGLEDWESILSESAGQDPSLLKWIYGDAEDSSLNLKQLIQGGNSNEIDGNGSFGVLDQSSGLEALETGAILLPSPNHSSSGFSGAVISGFCSNGRIGNVPSSISLGNNIQNLQNQNFSPPAHNLVCVPNAALNVAHQQQSQHFLPQFVICPPPQFQNVPNLSLLNSLLSCTTTNEDQPLPKRQNLGILNTLLPSSQLPRVPLLEPPDPEFLSRKQPPQQQELHLGSGNQFNLIPRKPVLVPKQEVPDGNVVGSPMAAPRHQLQQQLVYDQLYKATELILAGNFSHAQGILARLNHQLSPAVKPFQRAAFYFKEALQMLMLLPNRATSVLPKIPTPLDGIFKMGAYKMLSEASPFVQFMNFTSNQALLEALDGAERIHIIDFDIGCGAQWSSFMQELPKRNRGSASLKITAFASPSIYHSVEISLMHESLTLFANDLGISFELELVNFDSFDPSAYAVSSFRSSETDKIAVNFPLWSIASRPTVLPSLLCFLKQLCPKVVVILDRGCERFELPPSHHLLNALQYYEGLLDSLDAANLDSDCASKIERFLLQPRIESIVFGRLHLPNQIPPWASLLASAGFSSFPHSNFAEAQAECVVKRTQARGFHVEKRQASLTLCWQRQELLSASIWKC